MQLLTELWPDAMGARLIDITRNGLLLLIEHGLTIAEMPLLLSDAEVRQLLVSRSQNAEVRVFFEDHLGGLRAADQRMWLESSRNKWASFASSPFIRPIIGQSRSTIDFREILDRGKILLVNLSRHRMKQESRSVLGGLIIHSIHQAAIARDRLLRFFKAFEVCR